MILPLYTTGKLDNRLLEAASDLGAGPIQIPSLPLPCLYPKQASWLYAGLRAGRRRICDS